jgi:hypothetical protein
LHLLVRGKSLQRGARGVSDQVGNTEQVPEDNGREMKMVPILSALAKQGWSDQGSTYALRDSGRRSKPLHLCSDDTYVFLQSRLKGHSKRTEGGEFLQRPPQHNTVMSGLVQQGKQFKAVRACVCVCMCASACVCVCMCV